MVVSVGCYSQTFGIEGVRENALFLKDVGDARKIRKRILECEFISFWGGVDGEEKVALMKPLSSLNISANRAPTLS